MKKYLEKLAREKDSLLLSYDTLTDIFDNTLNKVPILNGDYRSLDIKFHMILIVSKKVFGKFIT